MRGGATNTIDMAIAGHLSLADHDAWEQRMMEEEERAQAVLAWEELDNSITEDTRELVEDHELVELRQEMERDEAYERNLEEMHPFIRYCLTCEQLTDGITNSDVDESIEDDMRRENERLDEERRSWVVPMTFEREIRLMVAAEMYDGEEADDDGTGPAPNKEEKEIREAWNAALDEAYTEHFDREVCRRAHAGETLALSMLTFDLDSSPEWEFAINYEYLCRGKQASDLEQETQGEISTLAPKAFSIFVRTFEQGSSSFEVDDLTRISTLKSMIEMRFGAAQRDQRLIYQGKQLAQDDKKVGDYEMEENDTIHLWMRLRGGARSRKSSGSEVTMKTSMTLLRKKHRRNERQASNHSAEQSRGRGLGHLQGDIVEGDDSTNSTKQMCLGAVAIRGDNKGRRGRGAGGPGRYGGNTACPRRTP